MTRWFRRLRLSELYMWLGAIFTIGVVIVAEFNKALPAGQNSPWVAFFPQLTATLVGGTLAASVAFGLNRRSRFEMERDAAIRLIIKLKLIADDFYSVVKTLELGLIEANNDRMTHLMMWQRVRPVVGLGDAHLVDPAEAAAYLSHGYDNIANGALLIAVRHRTFLASVIKYNELRAELTALVPPTSVEGPLSTTEVPPEKRIEFQVKSSEIEDLVRDILRIARRDGKEARDLCDQIGPAAQRIFNDSSIPTLSTAEIN